MWSASPLGELTEDVVSSSFIVVAHIPIFQTPPPSIGNVVFMTWRCVSLEHSLTRATIPCIHSILLQCEKFRHIGVFILPNTRHQHRHQCLEALLIGRLHAVWHRYCVKNHIFPAKGRVGRDWGTGKRRYCLPSNKSGTRSQTSLLQVPRSW